MSMTNTFETEVLQHFFQNADIANIGDAGGVRGSVAAGNFYIALFTADPTETGSLVNEATFGGYARQPVARSGAGFTVTNDVVSNAGAVTFPECTSGSETVTHFAIMDSVTGGAIKLHAALGASRLVNTGVTLEFAAGQLTVTAA